jgi:hypothetical protein
MSCLTVARHHNRNILSVCLSVCPWLRNWISKLSACFFLLIHRVHCISSLDNSHLWFNFSGLSVLNNHVNIIFRRSYVIFSCLYVVCWSCTLSAGLVRCLLVLCVVCWSCTLSAGLVRCLLVLYFVCWSFTLSAGLVRCLLVFYVVCWSFTLSAGLLRCLLVFTYHFSRRWCLSSCYSVIYHCSN